MITEYKVNCTIGITLSILQTIDEDVNNNKEVTRTSRVNDLLDKGLKYEALNY